MMKLWNVSSSDLKIPPNTSLGFGPCLGYQPPMGMGTGIPRKFKPGIGAGMGSGDGHGIAIPDL
ncbi:unnamed protein product [Prunus armeniaca]